MKKIEKDKWGHLLANFMMVVGISSVSDAMIGSLVAISVSFGKEVHDLIKKDNFSVDDLLFDFVGIGAGLITSFLIGTA